QKEIYEESKHGVAYRDLKHHMNLDAKDWVLGKDYTQAPTCATCHMSGNSKNGGEVTHDPGRRISWTNRPPVSAVLDTDKHGKRIKTPDEAVRQQLLSEKPAPGTGERKPMSWQERRSDMKLVCSHCHTGNYVDSFYKQYDDFVINYNEKFAKPGRAIIAALRGRDLITDTQFDEEIEWTWFYLWHHEGRRARHGASMMAPDYAHWHGMFEVAERFYQELIPQAREIADHARSEGKVDEADEIDTLIDEIILRPEHEWFKQQVRRPSNGPRAAN
ncbi:MAG: multiheme c-type cytochrome, partial [Pirellulaceae bacterium]|nr:multiheme c-type cytochrome [Pirellulaceae bacterium]